MAFTLVEVCRLKDWIQGKAVSGSQRKPYEVCRLKDWIQGKAASFQRLLAS